MSPDELCLQPEEPEAELAVDEPAEDTANQPPKPFSWANVVNKQQSGGNAAAVAVVSPMNSAPAAKNVSILHNESIEIDVLPNVDKHNNKILFRWPCYCSIHIGTSKEV